MQARRPNVVIIVLDDLGFAQLGCYGSDIATPNIDALAQNGLRYNAFHVTAICSSTRACLLTGRNHHSVGMGFIPELPLRFPGYSGRVPKSAGALPRLLRDAGYGTFAVGKWHLTPRFEMTPSGPFGWWPLGMGFERFHGFLGGMTNQWAPELVRDNGFLDSSRTPEEGYHLTEDLVSQGIRFVQDQQQASPGRPFFLYVATGAMHSPHQVPAEWIDRYRSRFRDGWEAWRTAAFARQQASGLVPSDTVLTERPSWVAAWDSLAPAARDLYSRQMEVYAGFLSHTDAQIGRLIDFLARIGELDNTIVMVVADNGASAEGGPHGLFNRVGPEVPDAESLVHRMDELGGFKANGHYAWGWAWAGNTPFRLWKRYSWLGGVRVPLIVHWPSGMSTEHGGHVRSQFCHATDVMPTIFEAAGVSVPDTLDGVSQRPLDGRSILATINDARSPTTPRTQYFETMGSRAIYVDGWKATTNHIDSTIGAERELIPGSHAFEDDEWSLFNLDEDFSEAHDVSGEQPALLRSMVERWWSEAGRNSVLPLMDGFFEARFAMAERPPSPPPRRYVYFPGGGPIVTPAPSAGFVVTVEIDTSDGPPTGVICAQGDWNGGWACYALDGDLIVTFAFVDGTVCRLDAKNALAGGHHEIVIAYRPAPGGGSIELGIDGEPAGTEPVSLQRSQLAGNTLAGKLMIGRDQGLPVSDDYRPPFPFSGRIDRVVFETLTRMPAPAREQIEHALKQD